MAKLSQGFYLTFFSTASLLYKKKALQGRQEIDNAGAHVFTRQLVTHLRRSCFVWATWVRIQTQSDGIFMIQAAWGELAPHERGKRAHISPVCHPCSSGAWSQLGWPQNRWARETASQSGPTVGQIFMWAVKVWIATYLDKHSAWGGHCRNMWHHEEDETKQNFSYVSGGPFLSHPSVPMLSFPSTSISRPQGASALQQAFYCCGQVNAPRH